jgi:hypothetical protein
MARAVLLSLELPDVNDSNWSSYLLWSNLYKVSPAVGGNPADSLIELQQDACRRLLRTEINLYRPRRVVFATGMHWAKEFLNETPFRPATEERFRYYTRQIGELVVADRAIGKYVVAEHPMAKKESVWSREVITALNE